MEAWTMWIILFCCSAFTIYNVDTEDVTSDDPLTSEKIVGDLIHYFSQDDPKGIPVIPIPDPMDYPDHLSVNDKMSLWGQEITGFSNIHISSIVLNFTKFTAGAEFKMPWLTSVGKYSWKSSLWWDSDSEGATNITLGDVTIQLDALLTTDEEGTLKLDEQNTKLEMEYGTLEVEFENLSAFYLSLVKIGLQTSFSTILEWIKEWLVDTVNPQLHEMASMWHFPDSTPHFDYLVSKIRPQIRLLGLDPWYFGSTLSYAGFGVYIRYENVEIKGLSSLHRTHDVHVKIVENSIAIFVQVGTSRMEATADWSIPYAIGVGGHLHAEIDHFSITLEVRQATDFRSAPNLRDLDCHIGNIAVTSSGMGSLDYLLEAGINIFPNVFRNQILDRFEKKLWEHVQKNLNYLDLKTIILHHMRNEKVSS